MLIRLGNASLPDKSHQKQSLKKSQQDGGGQLCSAPLRSAKLMIIRDQVTFSVQGDHFKPSEVKAPYASSHDPGVIGKLGRYRGIPVPYGAASFDAPGEEEEKIAFLHRIIHPLIPALKAAGAESFWMHITYHYDCQCAIGFSKEEMRMISELECDVPIDCWRTDVDENAAEQISDGNAEKPLGDERSP